LKNSKAPKHLSAASRQLWRVLVGEYAISDAAGLAVLEAGLEARDRMLQARKAIDCGGAVLRDRWGQAKPHPLLTVERDCRSQFLAAIKQLGFDVEPTRDRPGRPPAGGAR